MPAFELTPEQENLRSQIESALQQLKDQGYRGDNVQELLDILGKAGHELHISLTESGHEPKHHAYMIKNRGMAADHPEFYRHVHPAEDLLAFIKDPHANDDPVDQTVGDEFRFTVYSRRWNHEDTYKVTRTETGWDIGYMTIGGRCEKNGKPYLYENLDHDSINYPEALPDYFEWLWERAAEDGLSHQEVQNALDQLAGWISICEGNSPGGIFGGLK